MKYVLIGDDMFYRTLEGLLLKCLGPSELNRIGQSQGLGRHRKYGKWSPTWHGPYKVDQVLPGNAYMLAELDGVKFPVTINGKHLKKYFPSMWEGE